ncbi:MAG: M14 family zinc carboxypeptidase [Bacteroidota bacterium]
MKRLITFWILVMSTTPSFAQHPLLPTIGRELFDSYEEYKLPSITTRRFTQAEMLGWVKPFQDQGVVTTVSLGQSAEGRSIPLLSFGAGGTTVLLWSQMHGDEPTATMALMDILNFFSRAPEHIVTTTIRRNLTIRMIPMINPDGAERFQRRTVQMIDMNRDAQKLETPEARILKEARETYAPQFGFNLHDQDPRYTVGNTKKVSAIALLAPAFDESRSDNDGRRQAKHLAATFAAVMSQFIEGHVSKYDDTFEPRAFGDNIQKWGTSTILVESGGWANDREKMFLRKINAVGLLVSLYALASGDYRSTDLSIYEHLPFNTKYLYDIIVRNATFRASETAPELRVDIGITVDERRNDDGVLELVAKVVDIGDLSVYAAFEEIDAGGSAVESTLIKLDEPIPAAYIETLRKR